jgi:phosphotriesterase-related protein
MRTKAWNTFLPNDAQRIEQIMELIADGYLEKILISHDIYFKDVRSAYGGHGTSHILRNIVPAMRAKGITEEQIHKILVENPKRILTFVPPEG